MTVEFRLLGPVEVHAAGRRLDTGQPRQRAVLAALLADAGRVVTVGALIDRVWGQAPPAGARRSLQAHVTRVRRILDEAGLGAALVNRAKGYVIDIDPASVDVHRFRSGVAAARTAGSGRAPLLNEVIDLWQGEPLTGVDTEWAGRVRQSWTDEFVAAVVDWAHAELHLGNAATVLRRLADCADRHPYDEALTAVRMQALAACGRGAEALDAYRVMRQRLIGDLGAEPSPALREVHLALLRGPSRPAAVPRPRQVPAQLPADVTDFVGRHQEQAVLDELLRDTRERGAVLIAAVSGTAGVGKTAFVTHWAHRTRHLFPDGQLYVNLRGYDPGQPMVPADALASMLSALGVAGADIPLGLDERAALYRTRVSERRLLIVLDNAADAEQVRPLLPGSAACTTLVTSRDTLAGLVALCGAHRLVLDRLSRAEAGQLLARLIGSRGRSDPEAVSALAELCADLPLALRVGAELAVTRSAVPLAALVEDLREHRHLPRLLTVGGDPRAAVPTVFSWSLRGMPGPTTVFFRLLGAHPGPHFGVHDAGALTATPAETAQHHLDTLARAHLVQPASAGRWTMHDLLRSYAAGLSADPDSHRPAWHRLYEHYAEVAAAAMSCWLPGETRTGTPVVPRTHPAFRTPAAARTWLDTHRECLIAAAVHATRHSSDLAVRLSAVLSRYLEIGGHYPDGLTLHGLALGCADAMADPRGRAKALTELGLVHVRQGRHRMAADHLLPALWLHRAAGDHAGAARTLNHLGVARERQGRYRLATRHLRNALALCRDTGDRHRERRVLNNLGVVCERLGRHDEAAEHLTRALELCADDVPAEAAVRETLGVVHGRLGRYPEALGGLRHALALFGELGDRSGQAYAINNLGVIHRARGDHSTAAAHHRRALIEFQALGDRCGEAEAHNALGESSGIAGHHARASEHHHDALRAATLAGERYEQARALAGLAVAHRHLGTAGSGRAHAEAARQVCRDLGIAVPHRVAEMLSGARP
ncbi:AfsR/SARP family transcriptional regulator [Jidongwangia harbinensis]|uniref:AfsR/SARP family transcriptional regulator n=1 Tax=Jidongwangia harbinensis TaxID=2878561 RepID=UPI001CD99F57|nr:tetratricopeptide repeat protein [Jidongwangia harbinensis]MCA2214112.1 tetratricopeptide repeat protein [Jidongwangia harbinensis]